MISLRDISAVKAMRGDIMADNCKGCIYWRSASDTNGKVIKLCHYLLDTGERRGCPADKCTRKVEKAKPERRRGK